MATIMSCSASAFPLTITCSAESRSRPPRIGLPKPSTSTNYSSSASASATAAYQKIWTRIDVLPRTIKETSLKLLDDFVDRVFEFVDQPYLPSQTRSENPSKPPSSMAASLLIFRRVYTLELTTTTAVMESGQPFTTTNVSTNTFELEKERKKPVFLPATEGDPPAVLSALLLNLMRFGVPNKTMSNTNVFEHAGKCYASGDGDVALHEIHIPTLETIGTWEEIAESWNHPFTSHPKKAPGTGELVIIGIDAKNPYLVLGVISADGKKLLHKVDLKFKRCILFHELGVTQRYNIIPDFPIALDINRFLRGGPLVRYEKDKYARIGVMPRYGDVDSVRWFEVKTCCAFHIINCYEEDDEVVVMACIAQDSIISGPELGRDKLGWFSRGLKKVSSYQENMEEGFLFARSYEWRLNMKTGQVKEKYLVALDFAMDFPVINDNFIGVKNKFAYAQLVDSAASSAAGMVKYGGLAKLSLQERNVKFLEGEDAQEYRKIEYHMFPENTFCTGASFVAKHGSADEDDGWLVTFVHNEDTNTSEVYIVDAKNISSEAVARIRLPCRVPYGFHGAYMPLKRD
ncbi:UNVERIFIED_CONTAM: Carotenoid 9,10(9',10')-cleavage dioxygenase 1 [Sesamum radiatum]|uniref:Carotenoid 9,10(9',10')-cleavage dioxygenase 1 n=1 Tax=Sesamum radiatum TaxID=300843 RepID=A0AAW2KZM3_SESRA